MEEIGNGIFTAFASMMIAIFWMGNNRFSFVSRVIGLIVIVALSVITGIFAHDVSKWTSGTLIISGLCGGSWLGVLLVIAGAAIFFIL